MAACKPDRKFPGLRALIAEERDFRLTFRQICGALGWRRERAEADQVARDAKFIARKTCGEAAQIERELNKPL